MRNADFSPQPAFALPERGCDPPLRNQPQPVGWFRFLRLALLLAAFVVLATPLLASDLKVEARLIWGTNDDKFSDPKYKPVDEATAANMRKVFKWKHYFEVNRKTVAIPSRQTRQIKMSEPCTLEITELEGPRVEVKLIGKGKPVNKSVKPLRKGESFTIGGDDKNDCAWFIIITEL